MTNGVLTKDQISAITAQALAWDQPCYVAESCWSLPRMLVNSHEALRALVAELVDTLALAQWQAPYELDDDMAAHPLYAEWAADDTLAVDFDLFVARRLLERVRPVLE